MNICILTGAGFVKPLGLPTTTEFDLPEWEITRLVQNFLGRISKNPEDIENVIAVLEDLVKEDNFAVHIASTADIANVIERRKGEALNSLVWIKKSIYSKLKKFNEEEAFRLYFGFLKTFDPQKNNISFITTNYDRTFERAFSRYRKRFSSIGIKRVVYHFSEDSGDLIFDPQYEYKGFDYVKLHGSLDWYEEDGRVVKTSAVVLPDDPDEPPILYPGYKSMPDREPFISLHRIFLERLFWSDLVVIVGFSLRDEVIGFFLDTALQRKKGLKVLFINPAHDYPPESWYPYFADQYRGRFLHIPKEIEVSDSPLEVASVEELLQDVEGSNGQ